ncbi:restriction endonuclease subunit S [Malikia granosa]|nr:restriction endonuclease subunit S [Malikia granosa]
MTKTTESSDNLCIMSIDAVFFPLGSVATVRSGYPFRGSIEESAKGDVLAVQMKDVDLERGVSWPGVIRTSLAGRKEPDWLKAGDVLFVSKGARFYAVCIDEPPNPAVCSPHFFHLEVAPQGPLLPAFLAWQINQPPFQRQLQQAAEGSSQLSIRRPVLESLSLSVPPLVDQHRVVALAELARKERRALYQLIHNRERQLQALAEDLAQSAQASH